MKINLVSRLPAIVETDMAEIVRKRNEELKRTAKAVAEQFGVSNCIREILRGDRRHLHVKRAPKS
jgi:hypothetical protein